MPSSAAAEGGTAPRRSRVGELVFAGLVIALGVFALVGSFGIKVPVGNRVGPTVFPIVVSVLLLVAGTAVLIGVLRGRLGAGEESEDIDPNARTDWWALVKISAIVVGHLLIVDYVGWAPAAALLFGGVAWVLGAKRWWMGFVIGVVVALVVAVVFGELLGLSLPRGPLMAWLGYIFP